MQKKTVLLRLEYTELYLMKVSWEALQENAYWKFNETTQNSYIVVVASR